MAALKTVQGLENVVMYRPGYAIEYNFFDPTQLQHTLETKRIKNLFFAGQINGTTGYEEAAGQGIIAGINAHRNINNEQPFTLARNESYIGVLIDDLVNKGVDEPYRMFTSRAEYRILLRQDNADERLTEKAYQIGLAKANRHNLFLAKQEKVNQLQQFLENTKVRTEDINPWLEANGISPLQHGCKLHDLVMRPQITIESLAEVTPTLRCLLDTLGDNQNEIIESAEINIKYAGYIDREQVAVNKMQRLEQIYLSDNFDYQNIQSLSTEARQKLTRIKPKTIGEASRIPGVSPNDISVLLVLMGR